MMQTRTVLQIAILAVFSSVANADILLTENFNSSVPGSGYSGNISNSVFKTTGSVDIVGDQNGSFFLCSAGAGTNCLDMVGESGAPNSIQSISAFSVVGGQSYRLTFDASGAGSHNGFTWNGSAVFGADQSLFSVTGGSSSNPISHVVWNFTPVANESNIHLVFNDFNAPNSLEGISLDNVQLQTFPATVPGVPEPSTLPVLGATLAVLVVVGRRYTSARSVSADRT